MRRDRRLRRRTDRPYSCAAEDQPPLQQFQINIFQALRLYAHVESFSNDFCARVRDPEKKLGIFCRTQQHASQFFMIMLRHKDTAHAVLDRFGNPAMLRGKHR
jgi:hypothetical protein